MQTTRTPGGSLEISDTFDSGRRLYITPNQVTIALLAVDRDTDQRVTVIFGAAELDALAAEILRIREERSI